MAINIVYQPDPMLVGEAAYQIGQGEYARDQQDQAFRQQQLAEQSRQFDARNALDQQQFDLARENSVFEQQLARNREQLARRGLAMDFLNRQQDIGAQFMLQDQQQRGAMARQSAGIQADADRQYQQYAYQSMMTDMANVRRELPKLDPQQQQQVLDQFYQNWSGAALPLPMPFNPQVPDWADPAKVLESRQKEFPGLPWTVDQETGEVGLPRGFNFMNTPEGMQRTFEHQKELEGMKTQFKQADAQVKIEEKQAEQQRRNEDHDQDAFQRWQKYDFEMRKSAHEALKPDIDQFTTSRDDPLTPGKQVKNIDYAAYANAVKAWQANAPRVPQAMSQPPSQLPPPGGGRKQVPSSPDQPISVSSLEEAASYATGTWVRTPSGKVGQVR